MAPFSFSALLSFVATHQSEPFWIGVDVHKRPYHLAFFRADGQTFTLVASASPEKLVVLCRRLDIVIAVSSTKQVQLDSIWRAPFKQKRFLLLLLLPAKFQEALL